MAIWEDIDEDENMYDGPDGYDDEEDEELDLELAAEQLMETAAQEADSVRMEFPIKLSLCS
jgi:hypothetical protein